MRVSYARPREVGALRGSGSRSSQHKRRARQVQRGVRAQRLAACVADAPGSPLREPLHLRKKHTLPRSMKGRLAHSSCSTWRRKATCRTKRVREGVLKARAACRKSGKGKGCGRRPRLPAENGRVGTLRWTT